MTDLHPLPRLSEQTQPLKANMNHKRLLPSPTTRTKSNPPNTSPHQTSPEQNHEPQATKPLHKGNTTSQSESKETVDANTSPKCRPPTPSSKPINTTQVAAKKEKQSNPTMGSKNGRGRGARSFERPSQWPLNRTHVHRLLVPHIPSNTTRVGFVLLMRTLLDHPEWHFPACWVRPPYEFEINVSLAFRWLCIARASLEKNLRKNLFVRLESQPYAMAYRYAYHLTDAKSTPRGGDQSDTNHSRFQHELQNSATAQKLNNKSAMNGVKGNTLIGSIDSTKLIEEQKGTPTEDSNDDNSDDDGGDVSDIYEEANHEEDFDDCEEDLENPSDDQLDEMDSSLEQHIESQSDEDQQDDTKTPQEKKNASLFSTALAATNANTYPSQSIEQKKARSIQRAEAIEKRHILKHHPYLCVVNASNIQILRQILSRSRIYTFPQPASNPTPTDSIIPELPDTPDKIPESDLNPSNGTNDKIPTSAASIVSSSPSSPTSKTTPQTKTPSTNTSAKAHRVKSHTSTDQPQRNPRKRTAPNTSHHPEPKANDASLVIPSPISPPLLSLLETTEIDQMPVVSSADLELFLEGAAQISALGPPVVPFWCPIPRRPRVDSCDVLPHVSECDTDDNPYKISYHPLITMKIEKDLRLTSSTQNPSLKERT